MIGFGLLGKRTALEGEVDIKSKKEEGLTIFLTYSVD